MTDNEIIKALEICANNGDCKECAINPHKGNYGYCTSLAIKTALDLINRQKAEIERFTIDLKILQHATTKYPHCVLGSNFAVFTESLEEYDKLIASISTEAVKEFAERLKEYVESYDVTTGYKIIIVNAVEEETIDNLVKETVGEG